MKSLFCLLLCFIASTYLAFAQTPDWKWQNPKPTGNNLEDVQFVDSLTGWAIGDAGTIIKTTNGGLHWKGQNTGTTNYLHALHFVDAQNGWVVGRNGIILRTMDGGITWGSQVSSSPKTLNAVYFLDDQNGWVVSEDGAIIRTTNGGILWQTQSDGTFMDLSSVFFINSQIGFAGAYNGALVKTSNGGENWQYVVSTFSPIQDIQFVDSLTGWAVGNGGYIIKTTDGGNSWQNQNSGIAQALYAVHFIDHQNGWAAGDLGMVLRTTNGGALWISQQIGNGRLVKSIHFPNSHSGYVVGVGGNVYKSSNGGFSWDLSSISLTTQALSSVHFSDFNSGWAVGMNGTVLHTLDRGINWFHQTSGTPYQLNSVHFINNLMGWAVGQMGTIIYTNNGGFSWNSQSTGYSLMLNSVFFLDYGHGWAVGQGGILLKTTNGGFTWQDIIINNVQNIFSIHFINEQTGFLVGTNGAIRKTTDGGSTWQNLDIAGTQTLFSVRFFNDQIGWIVGANETILKTTNGGLNWHLQPVGPGIYQNFNSIHVLDSLSAYVVGNQGKILRTTDGGNLWKLENSATSTSLNSVFFANQNLGWAVGTNGTIISTYSIHEPGYGFDNTLISGTIFQHSGSDCNPNPNAPKLGGRIVKATPGPFYAVSNSLGNYEMILPVDTLEPSNFNISAVPVQYFGYSAIPVCPLGNTHSILVDTIADTLAGKDFAYKVTECHHLNVQISSNRRRRCFRNQTSVSYLNQGVLPATNAFILVEFPRWVRPISASRIHLALNDSTWKFDLGTVEASSGGAISIIDSVICGLPEIQNLTQCTKATIFPPQNCQNNPAWNGANITISGACINGVKHITIRNTGTGNMTDSVEYTVFLDSILVRIGKVKLLSGDSLKLLAFGENLNVIVSVNQVANHPNNWYVTTIIEACNFTTSYYPRATANHFPKDQIPNSKTHCLPILDSYDPNDKQAFPLGFTANRIVKPGTQMEYLIRFQNTGSDTAFTVYVIDSLDKNLNPETLEVGAISHPYDVSMQTTRQGRTFLRWQFNHINLPDSNTNELRSHGFIQYRILPKPGIPVGSQARNEAAIYFDFNPPVLTNQTLTTFDNLVFTNPALNNNVQIITTVSAKLSDIDRVWVYPNPFTQTLLIQTPSDGNLSVWVCDMMGKKILSQVFQSSVSLSLGELPAGVYFLKFPEINRVMKVVKQE